MATAPFSTVFAPAQGLFKRLSDWHDETLTRRALEKLSAHELHDLGYGHGDIDSLAETAWTRR